MSEAYLRWTEKQLGDVVRIRADLALQQFLKDARRLSSEQRANKLIELFPDGSRGDHYPFNPIHAIRSLSFKRRDQVRICQHFITFLPHATDVVYRTFLRQMSPKVFFRVVSQIPYDSSDYGLLEYYMAPIIRELKEEGRFDGDFEEIFPPPARYPP
ncbi:MAG: hypothetical protein AAF577_03810 [Pseudomonadota bacterium]